MRSWRSVFSMVVIAIVAGLAWTATAQTQLKLRASDGKQGDNFASSVSVSGDYTIIGAQRDDQYGDDSGSAYIFKRSGATWAEQAKLTAFDGAPDDNFGHSVSIDGEYAIVGANGNDDDGSYSGSAYIFKRDGTSWTQHAKLTASDAANSDEFGQSVSISGDNAIVGANGNDDDGSNSGSAYIFKRDGTSWTQQAKLTASDAASLDYFGYSVSIDGEYAVVAGISYPPKVYIFKRDGTAWAEQDKLGAAGRTMSINGDYVIGGNQTEDNNSGAAYVFKRDGTTWSQEARLTASDAALGDYFGSSVSVSGEYAVVGAYAADKGAENTGSSYLFKRSSNGTWGEIAQLKPEDSAQDDYFGKVASLDGQDLLIGTLYEGNYRGAAYMFDIGPEIVLSPASLSFYDVPQNTSRTLPFLIKNTGFADLVVSDISLAGTNPGNFAIGTSSLTVAGGDSTSVSVTYSPGTTLENRTAVLVITHNASESAKIVNLSGNGFPDHYVTTVAGNGQSGNNDGGNDVARFNDPHYVASDSQGNLYVLEHDRIRKVTPDGTVSTLVIISSGQIHGLAVDSNGLVYFSTGQQIKTLTPEGVVTVVAGNGASSYVDGPALSAGFANIRGLAIDHNDNVFITADKRVRKFDRVAGQVTTLAGSGNNPGDEFADGQGTEARFDDLGDLDVDSNGNIYVADTGNGRIRKVTPGGFVSTIAGNGNGFPHQTDFNQPYAVAVDANGNIYVADYNNHRIRKIDPSGFLTTLAGDGTKGFLNGLSTTAQFENPKDLLVNAIGHIYVVDSANHAIRKIAAASPVLSVTPAPLSFSAVIVGNATVDSLLIINTGTAELTVSAITVVGQNSLSFETNFTGATLGVGDSIYVKVTFTPTTAGPNNASLQLTHNAAGSPSQVALTGTGTAPVIEVSPTALSMGTMSPGVVRLDSVKVKNTGTAALSVATIAASGADAGLFTVNLSALTLAGGDSAYVRIVFAPTTDGNFSTTLTLTHNAAGSPSHVALTGAGTAPIIVISPTELVMGPIPADSSSVDSVKVKNTGTLALGVSSIAVTGTDAALFAVTPSSLTVPPSDSAYVKIEFTPTTVGNFSASLTLVHNAGGPVQVPLTGTSVVPAPEVKLVFKDNFGMRGEQLRVPIFLENNDSVAVNGLQFDVALPDSILTFVGVTDSLGDKGFSVSAQLNPDRITVVVFTLSEGILLESTEIGALLYDVKPVLSNQIRGESIPIIQVSPHNTEVVDTLTNQVITHTVPGRYDIGIRGDANHDGNVSIGDVVTTVRVILGSQPPPPPVLGTFQFARHDGNGDAAINIVDVIYQVNRILGRPVDQSLSKVVYSPVTVDLNQPMASGTALYLPVTIDTDTPISGLQLAYTYDPSVVTIGEPRMAVPSDDVTLQWSAKDGILRVIVYSISGEAIVLGRSALIIPVTVPEGSTPEITLTEAVLSDPSGRDVPVRLGQTRVAVAAAPTSFSLSVARPNPFNPSTTIAYEVPEQTHVTLTIYNLLGQEVVRLMDQVQAAGRYEAVWHGVNSRGAGVASGVYLYRIVSGSGYTETKRMTLLK